MQTAEVPLSDLRVPQPRVQESTTTEASLRLDAVASAGFKVSRSKMLDAIKAGDTRWAPRVQARLSCRQADDAASGACGMRRAQAARSPSQWRLDAVKAGHARHHLHPGPAWAADTLAAYVAGPWAQLSCPGQLWGVVRAVSTCTCARGPGPSPHIPQQIHCLPRMRLTRCHLLEQCQRAVLTALASSTTASQGCRASLDVAWRPCCLVELAAARLSRGSKST